jgi:hypothetical protein
MKRFLTLLLTLALVLSLAACSGSQQSEPQPEEPEASGDPADQVKLIAENRDLWLVTDPALADTAQYAVTDLDENGRLELIATFTEGTGQFTSTSAWEVSEDFASLQPVEYLYGEGHSEPDIGWADSFRCYRGELGNFIVAMDDMRNGAAEEYYYQDFLLLREGSLDAFIISYCAVLTEDSNGDGEPELHAYYYAPGGDGIDEEELTSQQFASSADDFFGYAYDRYVMDLSWKQFDAEARKSEVDIPAALADSWSAFGFRKDMTAFNKLFVAPSSYYDKIYENGEKAPIVYGIESLPDYWTLQEISTEFEARDAIADGIDCHMIISQDMKATFHYNDETDARSPIDIENMSVGMAEDGKGEDGAEPVEAEDPEVTEEPAEDAVSDWMVVFNTEDGLNRFEATVGAEDGLLYVTWYWWSEEEPDADPVITKMIFTNGVG